ncbi:glycosyl hydrolase family 28-related protein [Paenibacillus ginsengarvi]|nr:glycosyl hydrolase family 28-related protein [Paenibacillus ginsengarvi]
MGELNRSRRDLLVSGAKLVAGAGVGLAASAMISPAAFAAEIPAPLQQFAVDPGMGFLCNVKAAPYNAKGDGVTDDTDAFEAALSTLESNTGGVLYIPAGTYILRYVKLRSRVVLRGDGNASALRLKTNTNTNLVILKDDSVVQVGIMDLAIDGNKDGNTTGNGIFLKKTTYLAKPVYAYQSNRSDLNSFIHNVLIYNCAENGIAIDYTQTDFVNVRALHMSDLHVWGCKRAGFTAKSMTDCKITNSVFNSNAMYGVYIEGGANNHYVNVKTFYNGLSDPNNLGSFYFKDSGRSTLVSCEAQEEYKHGFMLDGCTMFNIVSSVADSNGQENSTCAGFYLKGCKRCSLNGCAVTSFHTPSWQGIGVKLENAESIYGTVIAWNQLNNKTFEVNGTVTDIGLQVNGKYIIEPTVLTLGTHNLWVDQTGRLRMKNGAPTSDTDGTIVGPTDAGGGTGNGNDPDNGNGSNPGNGGAPGNGNGNGNIDGNNNKSSTKWQWLWQW